MGMTDMNNQQAPQYAPRRILLAVTGLSPQIVTETLYALAVKPGEGAPWVPTEIHLVTTETGRENARLMLLAEGKGWFHRLRRDYGLPEIAFDESRIHVIRREDGTPLDDIKNEADNRRAADGIAEIVRRLTDDPKSAVHASIAGGRKTMGFFLGYAMSLFGREQDRLSHVLVSEGFEGNREFFYPTPYSQGIPSTAPAKGTVDASKAEVWLGEIPFVRLRAALTPDSLRKADIAFAETVASVQAQFSPKLVLHLADRTVTAAGQRIRLPVVDFAFLMWVVERHRAGRPIERRQRDNAADAEEYIAALKHFKDEIDEDDDRTVTRLRKGGMEPEFLDDRMTSIKRQFQQALGVGKAAPYLLQRQGPRGRSHYVLPLSPDQITLEVPQA